MTRTSTRLLALAITGVLTTAACGDDGNDASPTDGAAASTSVTTSAAPAPAPAPADEAAPTEESLGYPLTFTSSAGEWTLDAQPERIVSLSPTATEMLFAVGAGDQVVAVDEYSTYPVDAPVTELSGFDPNVESVAAYDPDLVVIAYDANDLVAGLTQLGIPVLMSFAPTDIESGYAVMAELGQIVGRSSETAVVIATMQVEMDEALAAAPEAPVRIYHELDDMYFSVSSAGFVGDVYAALGAVNIADPADTDGYGYPQLTEEYIVDADPELIVITDQVGYTIEDVLSRPGWSDITAIAAGDVVQVDADVSSRWGPRLPDFVDAVAAAMADVAN